MNYRYINSVLLCILALLILIIVKNYIFHIEQFSHSGYAHFGAGTPKEIPVSQSNAFTSTSEWKIKKHAKHNEIEGYSSLTGVTAGKTIQFSISSTTSQYTAKIYRLGWYGGQGAAQVLTYEGHNAQLRHMPKADASTGLIEPNWPYELKLSVPLSWPSGMYFMKLANAAGYESYVPFVVESANSQDKILLVHSVLTDQAYNDWGGNSLYHGSTLDLHIPRAVEVSLLRPFKGYDGAGEFLEWEYPMIRWLEKNNYQVDYATDLDVHNHPELLQRYKLVMIVGHDEYWSKAMRNGYEAAVQHGTNLAIFAANTAYRQVRIEGATIINYKNAYMYDPMYGKDNGVVTGSWRDSPVNRPESALIGSSYGAEVDHAYPFIVADSSSWIYKNSGLSNGDAINSIVGYECDAIQSDLPQPPNLITLSSSPIHSKIDKEEVGEGTNTLNSNASIYTAPSGSMVFNAGTIGWSSGLDSFGSTHPHVSHAEEVITKNILNQLGT